EQGQRDREVLVRRERQDGALVGKPRLHLGYPRCGRGHSPMTWMKTFRGRDRSSSQKKTRCQVPSIREPSTIGIDCDDEESRPARMCEWPFGKSTVSSSIPSVRIERSSWR